jgi:hypothetical protein
MRLNNVNMSCGIILELIAGIGEWLNKHVNDLRPFDCAAWLLASAVLNLDPSQYPQLYDKIKSTLSPEAVPNPIEWLNIVHAMSVLNLVSTHLVSTVLKPEFVKVIGKRMDIKYIGMNHAIFSANIYSPKLNVPECLHVF